MKVYKIVVAVLVLCFEFVSSWNPKCQHYKLRQIVAQPGMHILCTKQSSNHSVEINVLKDGVDPIKLYLNKDYGEVEYLLNFLFQTIGTSNSRNVEKWKVYGLDGNLQLSIDDLIYEGTVVRSS